MISKNVTLIVCLFFISFLQAQKDGKDYGIIKAGIELKSMQSHIKNLSNYSKNIITGNPTEISLRVNSKKARETTLDIDSKFNTTKLEIIKSESEYLTLKKVDAFPVELKTKKRKMLDYIKKARNKNNSLKYKFYNINKSKNIFLESGRRSKVISEDGKNLIWYYQNIVKLYGEYLNLYK